MKTIGVFGPSIELSRLSALSFRFEMDTLSGWYFFSCCVIIHERLFVFVAPSRPHTSQNSGPNTRCYSVARLVVRMFIEHVGRVCVCARERDFLRLSKWLWCVRARWVCADCRLKRIDCVLYNLFFCLCYFGAVDSMCLCVCVRAMPNGSASR